MGVAAAAGEGSGGGGDERRARGSGIDYSRDLLHSAPRDGLGGLNCIGRLRRRRVGFVGGKGGTEEGVPLEVGGTCHISSR